MRFGSVKSPSRAFDAYVPAEKQRATEFREEGFISGDEAQWRLATLHVIDMQGEMDIEVGLVTPQRSDFEDRACSGVLPAGLYATLTQ